MIYRLWKVFLILAIIALILFTVDVTEAATPTGKFSASLSWKAPTSYQNGTVLPPLDIAGYEVRLAGKPASKWTILATLTRDKLTYDYNTTEIGEHCFQVRAFTKDVKGLWSESACKMISVVPGAPTEVKIIRLEWIVE